jgi:cysteine desulfurase / selenocysteine lyase
LEAMPAYQGGGDMIKTVSFEKSTYAGLPHKFEAGTPCIADVVGLGAAIDYLNEIGMANIAAYEAELLAYATQQAKQIKGLRVIGEAKDKGAILSFVLDKIHPHDIGTMLDSLGIAIRAGHHCAMPVMEFYGVPATARASFAMYNTSLIEVFG